MKIELSRDMMDPLDTFVLRVTQYAFEQHFPQVFELQMGKAIQEFVRTDPEVQILINEMVREAFKSVDLLKLVTEAVAEKVKKSGAIEEGA